MIEVNAMPDWVIQKIERINQGLDEGFFRERFIYCPWCGTKDNRMPADDGKNKCGQCGNIFTFFVHVTPEYTTHRSSEIPLT